MMKMACKIQFCEEKNFFLCSNDTCKAFFNKKFEKIKVKFDENL